MSDYLKGLVEEGYVETSGRGRYTVTNEGVDWLISQTDALRDLVEHVSTDVIGPGRRRDGDRDDAHRRGTPRLVDDG